MRIVITGVFEYPDGSAAASRVRHYAKGLHELGHEVFVVSMNPYVKEILDVPENHVWEKDAYTNYCLVYGQKKPHSRNLISHTINHFLCMANCGKYASQILSDLHQSRPIDVIIGYSNWYIGMNQFVAFAKKREILLLWDVCEWHEKKAYQNGHINPLYYNNNLGFHAILPRVDGIIAITSFLEKYFTSKKIPVVRLPAFIDPDEFAEKIPDIDKRESNEYRFTYLGIMALRDGPMMLTKAFQKLLKINPNVILNIVGTDGSKGYAKEVKEYLSTDPQLDRKVRFWGRVSCEQLYERLSFSDCFIFNRTSGRAAECSFPTRLPEFLATGKPVITSNVSDIAEYLEDNKDAIVVEPDSIDSLFDGMRRVVNLHDRGQSIGCSGKEKCLSIFNYLNCCQKLEDFIHELK